MTLEIYDRDKFDKQWSVDKTLSALNILFYVDLYFSNQ